MDFHLRGLRGTLKIVFEPELLSARASRQLREPDNLRTFVSSPLDGENDRGILICGTDIGVSISANKVPGIRAALTHDTYPAERAAKSNNAQIINMGARIIGPEVAKSIVDVWLASEFDPAGSSAGNVKAIDKLDSAKLT